MTTNYDTSGDIRIANGHISKSTILGDNAYLVTNFPAQTDTKYKWQAYVDNSIRNGTITQALSGAGKLYGKLSGTLTVSYFSPDMQDYFFTTVMGSQYIAPVTLYCFHPRYKNIAINCYMRWFENIADNGTPQTDTDYTNVVMQWNRGVIVGNQFSSAFSEAFS